MPPPLIQSRSAKELMNWPLPSLLQHASALTRIVQRGQHYAEGSALVGFALHTDVPLMFLNDAPGDGQAEASAIWLGGKERFKEVAFGFGRDAYAAVPDQDPEAG